MLGVAHPADGGEKPTQILDFEALVDTGYDLSMVAPRFVDALKLQQIREGASHSPLGTTTTTIHRASLLYNGEMIVNAVEVSRDTPRHGDGLIGQNVLLQHVLVQHGPGKGTIVPARESGEPFVVPGNAYPGGSKAILRIGAAVRPGEKPKHLEERQCVLDTGAAAGIMAPSISQTLKLSRTGVKKVGNAKFARELPEYRVSIWYGEVCLAHDLSVAEQQPLGSPVLLGQDFLRGCTFIQDGPNRSVRLEF
jgi:predicted aspartyl protease